MSAEAVETFTDTIVAVVKGRHRGKVGYCDEDEGLECFVYFGSWADGYEVVRPSSLREATKEEAETYRRAFQSSPERWYARTADLGH